MAVRKPGLKLDDTLDSVARLLADRPEITLAEMKAIATEVSGMADPESKRAHILHLAAQIPLPESASVY